MGVPKQLNHRNREWLIDEYITKDKTIATMVRETGSTKGTISRWLKYYGISVMRKKESREILRIKSINKFENSYIPIPESGCWIWVGHTELKDGYGRFYDYQTKKTFFAHRASWELFVGQIPVGGLVLHHCDTPPCVNPHHLFIGTVRDNYWDCHNKKRHSHGIKHGMSKLTEGDVRAIREDHKTNPEIAKRYGVTSTMIGYIKRHQNWRHVQ